MPKNDVIVQGPVVDPEETAQYVGRWVAIRNGHIVADADDLESLRALPGVRDDDMVWVVPPRNHVY